MRPDFELFNTSLLCFIFLGTIDAISAECFLIGKAGYMAGPDVRLQAFSDIAGNAGADEFASPRE
jgi:hypothetical protein